MIEELDIRQWFFNAQQESKEYLIIAKKSINDSYKWSVVPSNHGSFTTLEEAIEWLFNAGWNYLIVYDLSESFNNALTDIYEKKNYIKQERSIENESLYSERA